MMLATSMLASGSDLPGLEPVDRTYDIGTTSDPIQVDGVLSEDIWNRVPVAT